MRECIGSDSDPAAENQKSLKVGYSSWKAGYRDGSRKSVSGSGFHT